MRRYLSRTFILLALFLIILPLRIASAETLEENLNNLIGPKQQYNTMLSPVYLRNNTTEEAVSPQSGDLTLVQTDYVLPGVNGLDLEIKRIYKSGISNVREMKTKYVRGAWVDEVVAGVDTTSFYEDRYNIGIGMRFSFPAIEVRENSDDSNHMFLHTDSGDIYRLKDTGLVDGVRTYLPENQTIKDVVVKEDSGFGNGQPDGVSKYMMVGKDGKKTYFSADGRILGIVDRYGNKITFQYVTQTYQLDGKTKTKKLISKIIDTAGREVTIQYNEDYTFKVGPIENRIYPVEESYKESQNPDLTNSGDLKGKFQVVVNLPGGKKLVYDKSAVLVSDSKQVIRTRLQRVFDIDNKPKYHFWYEQPNLGFTYMNGTRYSQYIRYENLTQIDYLKSNRVKRYTYNQYTKKLNGDEGSMQYRKIVEKKELSKKGYDSSKSDFLSRFRYDVKAHVTYTYENEADGFGTQDYKEEDEKYLKDIYRYITRMKVYAVEDSGDARQTETKYTYNGIQELIETVESGNNHKIMTVTAYDEMKFPKKTEKTIYNAGGSPAVKEIENFRYDEYGNLTNYTGPLAQRNAEGYPAENDPHTVVYSYDYNRFHVLTLKTWYLDEDTLSQTKFTPDEKGNVVREERVRTGDGGNYIVTDFQYDARGNMVRKTVNSTDNTYVTNYEYGTDADGVDQKGTVLTREYGMAGGVAVEKKYVYDFYSGNMKAEIDGKGNRTGYEYDGVERLKKVLFADGTEKQYTYLEAKLENTRVRHVDQNQKEFEYEYDILGNLVKYSIYDASGWHVLNRVEYDFRGNKLKETDANGHSIRFAYDSADRLLTKEYYDKDTVRKESLSLTYTVGAEGGTVPLLVTVTDEDGYIKKYYYDIQNRLIRLDVSPSKENTKFSTTLYGYDFVGNTRSVTDAKNNTTRFVYDDLGRLAKQTDALGNETLYTYNSLDKVLTVEEPGGRVTGNIYDGLGRLVEQRLFMKGSSDYFYEKYTYDNAGNVASKKQGKVESGMDNVSSEVTYSYNSMNRLEDEYKKIDAARTGRIHYTYDPNGNRQEMYEHSNETGNKYIKNYYTYDYAGRPLAEYGVLTEPGPGGEIVERGRYGKAYTRDYAGNILTEEQLNGNTAEVTRYVGYDHRNRLMKKEEPYKEGLTKLTTYGYDKRGNLITETITRLVNGSESEASTAYEYDGLGNLIRKSDALGYTTRYVYDANGNLIKETDPRDHGKPENEARGIEYEYDAMNRLIKATAADVTGRSVIAYKEYDGRGNVTKQADSLGYNSANPSGSIGALYEYDAANNITKIISAQAAADGSSSSKKYTYDGSGRVLTEEDEKGGVTRYVYYLNGNVKGKIYPDAVKESYSYDLTGKLETVLTDRAGNNTSTYSNIFGKPYKIIYPDTTHETFEYNNKGEMTASVDRVGNVKYFEYDPSGNLTRKKEYVSGDGVFTYYKLSRYSYDKDNSLLSSETFNLKESVGQTSQTQEISAGDRVTYAYDKAGRLIKVSGPNGRETLNRYDEKGNLIMKEQKVSDGYYDAFEYTYDVQARVLSEAVLVETADIDLSRVSNPIPGQGGYAARIKAVTTYIYGGSGLMKSKKDANGNETVYEYDYDGRLIKKTDPLKQDTLYFYDENGNLEEERNARGVSVYYDYDSLNRLIRKKAPAVEGGLAITRYIVSVQLRPPCKNKK